MMDRSESMKSQPWNTGFQQPPWIKASPRHPSAAFYMTSPGGGSSVLMSGRLGAGEGGATGLGGVGAGGLNGMRKDREGLKRGIGVGVARCQTFSPPRPKPNKNNSARSVPQQLGASDYNPAPSNVYGYNLPYYYPTPHRSTPQTALGAARINRPRPTRLTTMAASWQNRAEILNRCHGDSGGGFDDLALGWNEDVEEEQVGRSSSRNHRRETADVGERMDADIALLEGTRGMGETRGGRCCEKGGPWQACLKRSCVTVAVVVAFLTVIVLSVLASSYWIEVARQKGQLLQFDLVVSLSNQTFDPRLDRLYFPGYKIQQDRFCHLISTLYTTTLIAKCRVYYFSSGSLIVHAYLFVSPQELADRLSSLGLIMDMDVAERYLLNLAVSSSSSFLQPPTFAINSLKLVDATNPDIVEVLFESTLNLENVTLPSVCDSGPTTICQQTVLNTFCQQLALALNDLFSPVFGNCASTASWNYGSIYTISTKIGLLQGHLINSALAHGQAATPAATIAIVSGVLLQLQNGFLIQTNTVLLGYATSNTTATSQTTSLQTTTTTISQTKVSQAATTAVTTQAEISSPVTVIETTTKTTPTAFTPTKMVVETAVTEEAGTTVTPAEVTTAAGTQAIAATATTTTTTTLTTTSTTASTGILNNISTTPFYISSSFVSETKQPLTLGTASTLMRNGSTTTPSVITTSEVTSTVLAGSGNASNLAAINVTSNVSTFTAAPPVESTSIYGLISSMGLQTTSNISYGSTTGQFSTTTSAVSPASNTVQSIGSTISEANVSASSVNTLPAAGITSSTSGSTGFVAGNSSSTIGSTGQTSGGASPAVSIISTNSAAFELTASPTVISTTSVAWQNANFTAYTVSTGLTASSNLTATAEFNATSTSTLTSSTAGINTTSSANFNTASSTAGQSTSTAAAAPALASSATLTTTGTAIIGTSESNTQAIDLINSTTAVAPTATPSSNITQNLTIMENTTITATSTIAPTLTITPTSTAGQTIQTYASNPTHKQLSTTVPKATATLSIKTSPRVTETPGYSTSRIATTNLEASKSETSTAAHRLVSTRTSSASRTLRASTYGLYTSKKITSSKPVTTSVHHTTAVLVTTASAKRIPETATATMTVVTTTAAIITAPAAATQFTATATSAAPTKTTTSLQPPIPQ